MAGVVTGVVLHALGEGTPSPVRFLWAFIEGKAEIFGHEVDEAELGVTEQAAGEHGVEDRAGDEVVVFAQEAEVVIGAVHDEFMRAESIEQRGEVEAGEGVDEFIDAGEADLEEADFFRVRMETVGFGIQGEPRRDAQLFEETGELQIIINHWNKRNRERQRMKMEKVRAGSVWWRGKVGNGGVAGPVRAWRWGGAAANLRA